MNKTSMIAAIGSGWSVGFLLSRPRLWRALMRFTMSPMVSPGLRTRVLRQLGVSVPWSAFIADNVFIGSPQVQFGENSGCSVDCFLDGAGRLTLEDNVRLGARCVIVTSGHPIEPDVVRRDLTKPVVGLDVTIGRGSWLCSNVTVVPGVTIGEGCVVAAGSVVTRDLEPNGLYAGSPARRIRTLPVVNAHSIRSAADLQDDERQLALA